MDASILQRERNLRGIGRHGSVSHDRHLVLKRRDRRIAYRRVLQFLDASRPTDQRGSGPMIQTDMCLQLVLRIASIAQRHRAGRRLDAHRVHRGGVDRVIAPQLQAGIDDRVDHDAAGVRFVGIAQDLEAFPQSVHQ